MTEATTHALRARNGNMFVFAANGFIFATWMSRVPDVRDLLQLTPSQLGMLLLALSVGAVSGLPASGRIIGAIGATRTVRLGLTVLSVGVVLAATVASLHGEVALVMLGLFFVGFGSGIWDVAQNLEGAVIERALGRSIMPWFHAAFSAGTVAAALLGALLVRLHVALWWHVAAALLLVIVVLLWGSARFEAGYADPNVHRQDGGSSGSAWAEPRTLLIGVMVLAAAFAEGTANDWLAIAFVDGHQLSHSQGVLALAVFLSFMTGGRIVGTRLLDNHGRVQVLRALFGLAIIGTVLVVFGSTWLAYVGAAIWGVGASLGFPIGMSAAADDPVRAPARLSVVSTIGYGAFLAGPPLLGFLGDHVGVLRALLVVAVASLFAWLVVPAAKEPAR